MWYHCYGPSHHTTNGNLRLPEKQDTWKYTFLFHSKKTLSKLIQFKVWFWGLAILKTFHCTTVQTNWYITSAFRVALHAAASCSTINYGDPDVKLWTVMIKGKRNLGRQLRSYCSAAKGTGETVPSWPWQSCRTSVSALEVAGVAQK